MITAGVYTRTFKHVDGMCKRMSNSLADEAEQVTLLKVYTASYSRANRYAIGAFIILLSLDCTSYYRDDIPSDSLSIGWTIIFNSFIYA